MKERSDGRILPLLGLALPPSDGELIQSLSVPLGLHGHVLLGTIHLSGPGVGEVERETDACCQGGADD